MITGSLSDGTSEQVLNFYYTHSRSNSQSHSQSQAKSHSPSHSHAHSHSFDCGIFGLPTSPLSVTLGLPAAPLVVTFGLPASPLVVILDALAACAALCDVWPTRLSLLVVFYQGRIMLH